MNHFNIIQANEASLNNKSHFLFVISSAWTIITLASLDGLICILFMFFFTATSMMSKMQMYVLSIVQSDSGQNCKWRISDWTNEFEGNLFFLNDLWTIAIGSISEFRSQENVTCWGIFQIIRHQVDNPILVDKLLEPVQRNTCRICH